MRFFAFIVIALLSFNSKAQSVCKEIWELEAENHYNFKALGSSIINNYNNIYQRCFWDVDPEVNYIKGSITTYFKAIENNVQSIQFDCSLNLTVDSVLNKNTKLSYNQSSPDLLTVNLNKTLNKGDIDSVTVFYKGVPDDGDRAITFTKHQNTPVMWTLSEPYGAKDWWPCKQSLNDKIDSIDIIVKTYDKYTVASNGTLVNETLKGAYKTFHWKHRSPITTYLVAIAITNYKTFSHQAKIKPGQLNIVNYVYPEDSATHHNPSLKIIEQMEFFDSLLISYPFYPEKYGHAQFSWGGGMEHQTMSFMLDFRYELMAHELAHQWFGDYITCGSWEDIWLNESFATYFEGLTVERFKPDEWKTWRQTAVNFITSEKDGSVWCSDTSDLYRIFSGRLSYEKGAMLLHMLRNEIGDDAFFNSIRNYLNNKNLANNYAHTSDLIKEFELETSKDLDYFFDQWYKKEGYPSFQLNWEQHSDSLKFLLYQNTSHPSVDFFKMDIPIHIKRADKDTTIIIKHLTNGQYFSFKTNGLIKEIYIDPDYNTISAHNKVFNTLKNPLSNVELFPNPATNKITIDFIPQNAKTYSYRILNSIGESVISYENFNRFERRLEINTNQLAQGNYFVQLNTSAGIISLKFVKTN